MAVPIAEMFLPTFNILVRGNLEINYLQNPLVPLGLVGFVAVIGAIGGSYPAFILSRYSPVEVLRGSLRSGRRGVVMRRALVVLQFTLSVGLILSVIVIYGQFDFLVTKDLGFNTKQIVIVPVELRDSLKGTTSTLKAELSRQPGVVSVAASSNYPCDGHAYGFENSATGRRSTGISD